MIIMFGLEFHNMRIFFGLVDSYVEFFNTMSNFEGRPHGGNLTFVECHVEYYTIS
jgi:hypothetical protein